MGALCTKLIRKLSPKNLFITRERDSMVSEAGFMAHKNCSVGDTVVATAEDGTEYRGTAQQCAGATVYVQGQQGQMLEFRRVRDSSSGEKAILLGIDGKTAVEDQGSETGINKHGAEVTKESTRISFDQQIVNFESEGQELVLGDQ